MTQKSPEIYWSLLKLFLNNKKIPIIPPLFHENKFITDFKEKAELFNAFFAKQCSLIDNNSSLPNKLIYLTEKRLTKIRFSEDDIAKIIQNLDLNKAHGHDHISIRMLKICGKTICKLLECIFRECLNTGLFPLEWKKANLVPIYKKGDKQCFINYRPVSLLPICSKIFEELIFNEMFKFWVLLIRAPSSTQLHPPPPSSFQSPPSSLQHPQQYLNQIIARNWAIFPNLGQKIKSCLF